MAFCHWRLVPRSINIVLVLFYLIIYHIFYFIYYILSFDISQMSQLVLRIKIVLQVVVLERKVVLEGSRPAILGGGQLGEIGKYGNVNSDKGNFCSMITYVEH